MSGSYDLKSGCAFFADMMRRRCITDKFAGVAFRSFRAAASTISVTLLHGDCLP